MFAFKRRQFQGPSDAALNALCAMLQPQTFRMMLNTIQRSVLREVRCLKYERAFVLVYTIQHGFRVSERLPAEFRLGSAQGRNNNPAGHNSGTPLLPARSHKCTGFRNGMVAIVKLQETEAKESPVTVA